MEDFDAIKLCRSLPTPSQRATSNMPASSSESSWKFTNLFFSCFPLVSRITKGYLRNGIEQRGKAPSVSFFQGSSNVKINNSNFHEIHGNASIIRFGDGQFTEIQRGLICDYMANLTVLPDIHQNLNRSNLAQAILNLPRAEAVFDDYQTKKKSGPCFEGTRVALLREMADWVTGTDESRMYVLSGLAGIGKSTVAYTIASRAADLHLLGASFFFSRYEDDRKQAKKFFTTIAYQLCVYDETFATAIGDVLQKQRGSAAITKGPQEQLQALIVEPLQCIVQSRTRPILVVIDALDECDEGDWFFVLTGLKHLVQTLPSFKVILTARPQPNLDRFFASQGSHRIFRLQDIEDKVVDGDIRHYLNHYLSLEQVQECIPASQWCASGKEIDALVRAAGRLFIIASTVVRIILDKVVSNPSAQMQKLLSTFAEDRMPFKDLNEFYTVILRNVVPVDCDDDIIKRYQSVIGTIISVQHPLPVSALSRLVDIDEVEMRAVLVNLRSVILLGGDDIPRIYHKSFPDYITDSKLCKDPNLRIDEPLHHMNIVICCFRIMEQHLKYNVLGLGTPARLMSNKDGFAEDGITDIQLEEHIPQHLRYACVYWSNHFEVTNVESGDLMQDLEHFANKHMLHWFEALSLMKKLHSAHRAIRVVLKVKLASSELRQLLSDGLRFISKFYETIERSALHTYFSALPFTPTDSLLYQQYIGAVDSIYDVIGGPKKWDALIANLNHGDFVDNIKFSPDSTVLVSLHNQLLRIWDAATGIPISTIHGNCFAIANDLSTFGSLQAKAITLYDVNGKEGLTFTSQIQILKAAISPEGSRIAAILSDGSLILWDCRNGELIGSHSQDKAFILDDLPDLQFSPTGTRLVYASANRRSACLRNGIDGSAIAKLDSGSVLRRIAISADGSRIAILSWSRLNLWSCKDGKLIGTAKNTDKILAISINGSLLATGDWAVTLWSDNCKNGLAPIKLQLVNSAVVFPRALAFSLDDVLIITNYDKIKLYNVKSCSLISQLSFSGSTALAFSPDCTRLAVGNIDYTIKLWDTRAIETFSNNQTRGVTALSLFPDYSRVACGFEGGSVELWETGSISKQSVAVHTRHPAEVTAIRCSPDGSRFASGSGDGTINLWDGLGGALHGTHHYPIPSGWLCPLAVEVSNTMLAVAGDYGIFLWDLKTLGHIHTFWGSFEPRLSFTANGAFLAGVSKTTTTDPYDEFKTIWHAPPHDHVFYDDDTDESVETENVDSTSNDGTANDTSDNDPPLRTSPQTIIFNVTNCTIASTFDIDSSAMAFLPDNSHLIVQHFNDSNNQDGELLEFNLLDKKLTRGPTFKYFIQLRNMPLWQDAPVFIKHEDQQWYLGASFHQCHRRVPILWIPSELDVRVTAQSHSMIVLGCANGDIILARLRINPPG